jgi:transposase
VGHHVLRLLAAGRSNQQIADEFVISLNTARHVGNIFDKTGAANRVEEGYVRPRPWGWRKTRIMSLWKQSLYPRSGIRPPRTA